MAKRKEFTGAQKDEIRRKYHKKRSVKNVFGYRRLQALYLRSQGKTNAEIGEICGIHAQFVTELVREYEEKGLESIMRDSRTTNNRRMSYEEEAEFLEGFREEAEAGQVLTVKGIQKAFEERTGKASNEKTVSNLLKRHGWRKVKPRPEHPDVGSESAREESKKRLTGNGGKSCWISI